MILCISFLDDTVEIYKVYETQVDQDPVGVLREGVFVMGDDELTADELFEIAEKLALMNGQWRCAVCGLMVTLNQELPSQVLYKCDRGHDVVVMRDRVR